MLDYKNIFLFDVETTGLDYKTSEIVEIAVVLLEKKGKSYIEKETVDIIISQDKPLPEFIVNLTGITDLQVKKEGISKKEAFKKIYSLYSKEALIIAYNANFDYFFLQELFREFLGNDFTIKNDLIDAYAIYKDFHNYPHKLESALETYPVGIPNSHRAIDDVRATYKMLKKMILELPDKFNLEKPFPIKRYLNVFGEHPKYRYKEDEKIKHVEYVIQYGNSKAIYNNKKR